jgi:hypothetical protein
VRSAGGGDLTIKLDGPFELESTQTVRFADLPTSTEKSALSGRLEQVHFPESVRAGTNIPVEVTARNEGQAVWLPDPPGTSGTRGVVGVSVVGWTASDGSSLPASDSSTAHVLWEVNPGQATTVTLHTQAPAAPGQYTLVLDLLSEKVAWFGDVPGGTRTSVPVTVEP